MHAVNPNSQSSNSLPLQSCCSKCQGQRFDWSENWCFRRPETGDKSARQQTSSAGFHPHLTERTSLAQIIFVIIASFHRAVFVYCFLLTSRWVSDTLGVYRVDRKRGKGGAEEMVTNVRCFFNVSTLHRKRSLFFCIRPLEFPLLNSANSVRRFDLLINCNHLLPLSSRHP